MTPPTPAAVRAAMKETSEGCTAEESRALCADDRLTDELLRDHIRAVAQEMKAEANVSMNINGISAHSEALRHFADKLEGKQS